MRYRFRPARSSDKGQLLSLLAKGSDIPLQWRNKHVVENNLKNVHVVDFMGTIVGMVHILVLSQKEGWLESAYIHPSYRGHGIGTMFAAYQVEYLKSCGVRHIWLATGYNNNRVKHFMGKLGFRQLGKWYRVTIPSTYSFRVPVGYRVKRVCGSHLREVMGLIGNCRKQKRGMGLITAPTDAYVWRTLDKSMLHSVLSIGLSLACYSAQEMVGVFLLAPHRGPSDIDSSTVVLQAYVKNSKAFQALLRSFLMRADKKSVFMSVSNLPDSVYSRLEALSKENSDLKLQTWVILGAQVY